MYISLNMHYYMYTNFTYVCLNIYISAAQWSPENLGYTCQEENLIPLPLLQRQGMATIKL